MSQVSDEDLDWLTSFTTHEPLPARDIRSMATELLAYRQAVREWEEASRLYGRRKAGYDVGLSADAAWSRRRSAERNLRALARKPKEIMS